MFPKKSIPIRVAPALPGPAITFQPASNSLLVFFSVALVFIRFSMLHQIQTMLMGVNLYLLYIIGVPAILGLLLSGGIRKTLQQRPGVYWTCFGAWVAVSSVFSSWRAESMGAAFTYLRTELVMMFVIAGAIFTWRDLRRFMGAIAAAAALSIFASRLFSHIDDNERIRLTFGTVANSNDYAGHLIMVLPFLVWVILSRRPMFFRIVAFFLIPYGIYVTLATASRGALIAVMAGILFAIWRGSATQRIAFFLVVPVILIATISLLPQRAWQRLLSFSEESKSASGEAIMSSEIRKYLLETSLVMMIKHPVFGVGVDQFSYVEGSMSRRKGEIGVWHETHNSYTQVGSECGLLGIGFFLAGIVTTMRMLNSVYRRAKDRPEFQEISATAFCLMLSFVSFGTAIAFLNFGYFFYLPALAGLAMGLSCAAEAEFQKAGTGIPASAVAQPAIPFVGKAANRFAPQPVAQNAAGPTRTTSPGLRTGIR